LLDRSGLSTGQCSDRVRRVGGLPLSQLAFFIQQERCDPFAGRAFEEVDGDVIRTLTH